MTKYIITRSTSFYKKPHKDAVHETVDSFEIRTTSREDLRDRLGVKDWKEYENYTVTIIDVEFDYANCKKRYTKREEVYCRRPKKEAVWTIEIDDLEKFADENDDIIIFKKGDKYPYRVIEIYDDYRE